MSDSIEPNDSPHLDGMDHEPIFHAIDSLRENVLSWIVIFITVSALSYPNILFGQTTFFTCLILSYFVHYFSHKQVNIFTIIHTYHHEHNNFLSHFSQILLEISCFISFYPLFLYKKLFLDPWILIYFVLFYSTIHNFNYGTLHVNNVHGLHHAYVETNIGPDICDILFGTKNKLETTVENTDHYIPNAVFSFCIVYVLQFMWKNDNYKQCMRLILNGLTLFTIIFLVLFSIYLWIKNKIYAKGMHTLQGEVAYSVQVGKKMTSKMYKWKGTLAKQNKKTLRLKLNAKLDKNDIDVDADISMNKDKTADIHGTMTTNGVKKHIDIKKMSLNNMNERSLGMALMGVKD